ncbi:MAG TPA: DNA translocase FtsK [Patescibacteria group bacterium]|nr:DNA translocase FtsK [Patescibacteria group bacterium]
MPKKKNGETKIKIPKLQAPELNLHTDTKRHIAGIVCLLFSILTFLSLIGLSGDFGEWSFRLISWCFGYMAYVVPVILLLISLSIFKAEHDGSASKNFYSRMYIGSLLSTVCLASLIHIVNQRLWEDSILQTNVSFWQNSLELALLGKGGGLLGAALGGLLGNYFGFIAALLILLALLVIGVLITFNISLHKLFPKNILNKTVGAENENQFVTEEVTEKNNKLPKEEEKEEEQKQTTQNIIVQDKKDLRPARPKFEPVVLQDGVQWKRPSLDLLDKNNSKVDSGDIESNMETIKRTLSEFGISVKMDEVKVGPTVTQYSLKPNTGVKLSQIKQLQDDLALALSAESLRMELPIPGKPLVGIEIPNKVKAMVRLREVLEAETGAESKPLEFVLGRDVSGTEIYADLGNLPHLLIAGASGKGKSVAINALMISLLYKNTPDMLKFIVIDPKKVEMGMYNGIPHLATSIITDKDKAANALEWATKEMDRRYSMFHEANNKRNITEYNELAPQKLNFLIIVIDELADLMQTSSIKQEVENSIIRLAQLGRAAGIHLVVATQYPKTEVITGLIKANITARMAFAVANNMYSRVILDDGGAEDLLGNGDMLFVSTEYTKPLRIQGAYVSGKEIKKVCDFLKSQTGAVLYNDEILEKPVSKGINPVGGGEYDEMYEEAKKIVLNERKASTSYIQRRLKIGYNRAANILEMMEQEGIVGPQVGSAPREIYDVAPSEKAEYGIDTMADEIRKSNNDETTF